MNAEPVSMPRREQYLVSPISTLSSCRKIQIGRKGKLTGNIWRIRSTQSSDIIHIVEPNQRAQDVVVTVGRSSRADGSCPKRVAGLDLSEAATCFVEVVLGEGSSDGSGRCAIWSGKGWHEISVRKGRKMLGITDMGCSKHSSRIEGTVPEGPK